MSSVEQARGLFERAAATFRSVLLDIRPHQLDLPTPCRPLNVAQLVSTAIGHQNWTRAAIAGTSAPRPYPDIAADRWVTEFDQSTATMLATIDDHEAMSRIVGLAAGLTFPAPDVAVLAARNTFQFGWISPARSDTTSTSAQTSPGSYSTSAAPGSSHSAGRTASSDRSRSLPLAPPSPPSSPATSAATSDGGSGDAAPAALRGLPMAWYIVGTSVGPSGQALDLLRDRRMARRRSALGRPGRAVPAINTAPGMTAARSTASPSRPTSGLVVFGVQIGSQTGSSGSRRLGLGDEASLE